MPAHQNLIYALKDEQITSIADVESGLKCGCVCPACGETLVAKKGSKVTHHFAHHAGTNCEYGYQTSLHLAAKDILSKAQRMVIPRVSFTFPGTNKSEIISNETEICIDHIELEKRFDDIIPDIVVYSGKKYFFVEIFVTHQVDEKKLDKLKKANISTIEIDLSNVNRMISPEELKDVLLQSNNDKKWIYNAAIPKWINRFRQISDKMKVTHGFTSRIYNCPIYMRIWSGRVYANAIDDCWHCQYRIADTEEYILCSGREQIAHIEDFKIPKKIRFKQRSELIAQRQAEPKTIRYCLLCGAVMVERWGRFGPFWGCSRYPNCKYTISQE